MTNHRGLHKLLGSLLAVILVGIYLSADLVGSLHFYFVHQEPIEEVCSLENEQDECHRTIYHNDTEHSCKHKEHFTKPILKCELCSTSLTHHVLPSKKIPNTRLVLHLPIVASLESRLVENPICAANSLRGPPSFS